MAKEKYLDQTGLTHLWSQIKEKINAKVDKENGKGLSTNDLTDVLVSKINNSLQSDTYVPPRYCFTITEDMVTVEQDATKGVAPYSTSYGYTNITVDDDAGISWVEGAVYVFVVNTKMVVNSSYRNVRVRIGTDGAWHPLMGDSSILSGSSYFVKSQQRLFVYKSTYRTEGALHWITDSNSTYAYLVNTITASGIKIDENGYGARYSLAFATTPLYDNDGLVSDERFSSLVGSSSTGTTKTVVNPKSGKFYIDRHPQYIYSANIAANTASANATYQNYYGTDLRYVCNVNSTYMTAAQKAFLYLKDFNINDYSFVADATVGGICTLDKLATRFPSTVEGDIYLYFLGWTTTWYQLSPNFQDTCRVYKYTPSTGEFSELVMDFDAREQISKCVQVTPIPEETEITLEYLWNLESGFYQYDGYIESGLLSVWDENVFIDKLGTFKVDHYESQVNVCCNLCSSDKIFFTIRNNVALSSSGYSIEFYTPTLHESDVYNLIITDSCDVGKVLSVDDDFNLVWIDVLTEHQDISGKVDKVTGKSLSTNDYDNAAKAKVDAIPNNPQYTDTVYDDTEVQNAISTLQTGKQDTLTDEDKQAIADLHEDPDLNGLVKLPVDDYGNIAESAQGQILVADGEGNVDWAYPNIARYDNFDTFRSNTLSCLTIVLTADNQTSVEWKDENGNVTTNTNAPYSVVRYDFTGANQAIGMILTDSKGDIYSGGYDQNRYRVPFVFQKQSSSDSQSGVSITTLTEDDIETLQSEGLADGIYNIEEVLVLSSIFGVELDNYVVSGLMQIITNEDGTVVYFPILSKYVFIGKDEDGNNVLSEAIDAYTSLQNPMDDDGSIITGDKGSVLVSNGDGSTAWSNLIVSGDAFGSYTSIDIQMNESTTGTLERWSRTIVPTDGGSAPCIQTGLQFSIEDDYQYGDTTIDCGSITSSYETDIDGVQTYSGISITSNIDGDHTCGIIVKRDKYGDDIEDEENSYEFLFPNHNGTLLVAPEDASDGQVLASDGDGGTKWVDATSSEDDIGVFNYFSQVNTTTIKSINIINSPDYQSNVTWFDSDGNSITTGIPSSPYMLFGGRLSRGTMYYTLIDKNGCICDGYLNLSTNKFTFTVNNKPHNKLEKYIVNIGAGSDSLPAATKTFSEISTAYNSGEYIVELEAINKIFPLVYIDDSKCVFSCIYEDDVIYWTVGSDNKLTYTSTSISSTGGGTATDVQINGTSITSNGVANIPMSNGMTAGVVMTGGDKGVTCVNGQLRLSPATNALITARNTEKAITPAQLDFGVKAALTDGAGAEWTEDEKAAARERLGISDPEELSVTLNSSGDIVVSGNCVYGGGDKYELINSATISESSYGVLFDTDTNGNAFSLKKIRVVCSFVYDGDSTHNTSIQAKISNGSVTPNWNNGIRLGTGFIHGAGLAEGTVSYYILDSENILYDAGEVMWRSNDQKSANSTTVNNEIYNSTASSADYTRFQTANTTKSLTEQLEDSASQSGNAVTASKVWIGSYSAALAVGTEIRLYGVKESSIMSSLSSAITNLEEVV